MVARRDYHRPLSGVRLIDITDDAAEGIWYPGETWVEDGRTYLVQRVDERPPAIAPDDSAAWADYRRAVWERDQRDLRESQTYQARRTSGQLGATAPKTTRNGINLADRNDEIRDEFEQRRADDPDRPIEFVIEDLADAFGLSTRQIRRIIRGE